VNLKRNGAHELGQKWGMKWENAISQQKSHQSSSKITRISAFTHTQMIVNSRLYVVPLHQHQNFRANGGRLKKNKKKEEVRVGTKRKKQTWEKPRHTSAFVVSFFFRNQLFDMLLQTDRNYTCPLEGVPLAANWPPRYAQ
jgi:hypothetical protein